MVQIVLQFSQPFWQLLGNRLIELVYAPFINPEMFWILLPLIATVLLMELYFSRYPREELGYHASLENTVFLLFVAVDLVRYIVTKSQSASTLKIILIAFIGLYALILGFFDFYHKLPRNVAFKTSSKSLIGFTAYIGIVLV